MTTKLTLSIDGQTIEQAKYFARETGRSLSEIVENYLESLIGEKKTLGISPKLRNIVGSVQLPKDFDEEKARREYLENKYL